MSQGEEIVMKGFIDCSTCGRAPSQLFRHNKTGKHFCVDCLELEYKKTPKVKLKAVPK